MRTCGELALLSNLLLFWTFVGNFVVQAFGNGIPFSNAHLWLFGPFVSNMLLLWTFVGKFIVEAFGNGIPF
jgi:hypothetical protein